jgi:hypothetical protein
LTSFSILAFLVVVGVIGGAILTLYVSQLIVAKFDKSSHVNCETLKAFDYDRGSDWHGKI